MSLKKKKKVVSRPFTRTGHDWTDGRRYITVAQAEAENLAGVDKDGWYRVEPAAGFNVYASDRAVPAPPPAGSLAHQRQRVEENKLKARAPVSPPGMNYKVIMQEIASAKKRSLAVAHKARMAELRRRREKGLATERRNQEKVRSRESLVRMQAMETAGA